MTLHRDPEFPGLWAWACRRPGCLSKGSGHPAKFLAWRARRRHESQPHYFLTGATR